MTTARSHQRVSRATARCRRECEAITNESVALHCPNGKQAIGQNLITNAFQLQSAVRVQATNGLQFVLSVLSF